MKKLIVTLALALYAFCGAGMFAQQGAGGGAVADVGMLKVASYSSSFLDKNKKLDIEYELAVEDDDYYDKVAALGGTSHTLVDTPLEIALLSYSAGVVDVRPVQADAVLPKNDPKLADLKLGAAVLQEVKILGFLGNRDAAGRYEAMLTFITGRGNATRAEIEAFYRQNIGALVSAEVDAQFNRVKFRLQNYQEGHFKEDPKNASWSASLTRDTQTGNYTITYGGYFTNDVIRTLSAPSLEALLTEMRNNTDKYPFNQISIDQVRAQAALIPAVVFAQTGTTASTMGVIKESLTAFYLNPTTATYNTVRDIYVLFGKRAYEFSNDPFFTILRETYGNLLVAVSDPLAQKVFRDGGSQSIAASLAALDSSLRQVARR
jgi:hypothetical protein